jgi:hypothetical protein
MVGSLPTPSQLLKAFWGRDSFANLRLFAWCVLSDLRSLQPKSTHQTFLAEEEDVDALLKRGGAKRSRDAGIDHDEAWRRAYLKAATLSQIIQRRVSHEEHGVTEFLNTRLKAVGGGDCVVVTDSLAIDQKGPVTTLPARHKARFHNARKNEDGLCLFAHELCCRIARIKGIEGSLRAPVDFGGARSPDGAG